MDKNDFVNFKQKYVPLLKSNKDLSNMKIKVSPNMPLSAKQWFAERGFSLMDSTSNKAPGTYNQYLRAKTNMSKNQLDATLRKMDTFIITPSPQYLSMLKQVVVTQIMDEVVPDFQKSVKNECGVEVSFLPLFFSFFGS